MEKLVTVQDLPTTLELPSRPAHLHHTQHAHVELGYHNLYMLGTKMSDKKSQKSVFQDFPFKCTMVYMGIKSSSRNSQLQ